MVPCLWIVLGSIAVLLALPSPARAQAGPEWLLGREVGRLKISLTCESTLYTDQGVSGQATDLGMVQHRLRGIGPLLQSERFERALFGGLKTLDVDTRAILPTTGGAFPGTLLEPSLGTAARGKLKNNWIVGGDLIVSFPSDEPFASFEEMTLTADAFLRIPWSKEVAGIFLLNYSTAREIAQDIPLPGFLLAYEPGPHLNLLVGMPFSSLRWAPIKDLELSLSYLLVRTVRTQVSYRWFERLRIYAGFDWDSQRFFRSDRSDDDHRLSYYEMRVGGGLRWEPSPNIFAEASGGICL